MTCKADHRQSQATLYDVPLFAAAATTADEAGRELMAVVKPGSVFIIFWRRSARHKASAQPCDTF